MGNRAVITTKTTPSAPAIYLHWNGGRDSVEAFLLTGRLMGHEINTAKGMDDFSRFLSRYFFGYEGDLGMTIYRMPYAEADTDNGDNGVYIVDGKTMQIIGREYMRHPEQREHPVDVLAGYIMESAIKADDDIPPPENVKEITSLLRAYADDLKKREAA